MLKDYDSKSEKHKFLYKYLYFVNINFNSYPIDLHCATTKSKIQGEKYCLMKTKSNKN